MSTEKNYNIREILNRLEFALEMSTAKEVAEFLGEKEGTVSAWKIRNSQSAVEKILYRSKLAGVDDKWLLGDDGPTFVNNGAATVSHGGIATAAGGRNRTVIGADAECYRTIPLSAAEQFFIETLREKDKENLLIKEYIADILAK